MAQSTIFEDGDEPFYFRVSVVGALYRRSPFRVFIQMRLLTPGAPLSVNQLYGSLSAPTAPTNQGAQAGTWGVAH